jgi:hypothetical protein
MLEILDKIQTGDEVIVDTSTGEWQALSEKDVSITTGALRCTDGTLSGVMEDGIDKEENALAHRVSKRAREASMSWSILDLTQDDHPVDPSPSNDQNGHRNDPSAGSSIASAIVID